MYVNLQTSFRLTKACLVKLILRSMSTSVPLDTLTTLPRYTTLLPCSKLWFATFMTTSCWKLLFWWCALVLGVKVYNFIFEYNNINIKFEVTWTTFIWLIMIFWLKFLCLISMIWFVVLLFFVHTSPTVWKFSTLSNHFISRIFLIYLLNKGLGSFFVCCLCRSPCFGSIMYDH